MIFYFGVSTDYAKNESTYDLLRKTGDAPNGVMDFIHVEMFSYLKSEDF